MKIIKLLFPALILLTHTAMADDAPPFTVPFPKMSLQEFLGALPGAVNNQTACEIDFKVLGHEDAYHLSIAIALCDGNYVEKAVIDPGFDVTKPDWTTLSKVMIGAGLIPGNCTTTRDFTTGEHILENDTICSYFHSPSALNQ